MRIWTTLSTLRMCTVALEAVHIYSDLLWLRLKQHITFHLEHSLQNHNFALGISDIAAQW